MDVVNGLKGGTYFKIDFLTEWNAFLKKIGDHETTPVLSKADSYAWLEYMRKHGTDVAKVDAKQLKPLQSLLTDSANFWHGLMDSVDYEEAGIDGTVDGKRVLILFGHESVLVYEDGKCLYDGALHGDQWGSGPVKQLHDWEEQIGGHEEMPSNAKETFSPFGPVQYYNAKVISTGDPIYDSLVGCQAGIQKEYDDNGHLVEPEFSHWVESGGPFARRLFPKLRFAIIFWSEHPAPGVNSEDVIGLALDSQDTVAIDPQARQVKGECCGSPDTGFGNLLKLYQCRVRNEADAKAVWIAFCEISFRDWKDWPVQQISPTEWHLGITKYTQTIADSGGYETRVDDIDYVKVMVDPATGIIKSFDHTGLRTNERKVRDKSS